MTENQLRQMYAKGYRYYCRPRSQTFEPLCVKTPIVFAEVCRTSYPNEVFDMDAIQPDGTRKSFKSPHWLVVGEKSKLVVYCAKDEAEANHFSNRIADTFVVKVDRYYHGDEKYVR
jgi:hypothetical protein